MIRAEAQVSPQLYARAIGVLYLTVIVLGFFAYGYVPGKLVSANVAVTANNILAHAFLWRAGVVAGLIVVVCAVPQLLLEYLLLRPVQRNLALLGLLFNVISLVIESLSGLGHLAALAIVAGQDSLKGVAVQQLQAWASLAIDVHDADLNVSFLFFGCVCLLYGVLMSGVPLLLVPAGLSELILCLWLLIVGVDVPKWHLWSAQRVGQPV